MIRKEPNQPIDFDPDGKTIPNLFDEYDRLADHYFKRHKEPFEDFARIWKLAHIDTTHDPEDLWQMRFSTLSFVVQMPHLDLFEEAEKLKGSALTKNEKSALEERAKYVKQWLTEHAPEEFRFTILEAAPNDLSLTADQKKAFTEILAALSSPSLKWEGPEIHAAIHVVKEKLGVDPKNIFQPLYMLFLGRQSGPQVGWFLSTFERDEVIKRLGDVTK
jgi:lysyl-tRNA synthetase class 1